MDSRAQKLVVTPLLVTNRASVTPELKAQAETIAASLGLRSSEHILYPRLEEHSQ
jgi:hypothetical protein